MEARGSSVVTGSWERALKFWNLDSGQETVTVHGTPYDVCCVSISSSFIAAGTDEGGFFAWDAQTFELLRAIDGRNKSDVFCSPFVGESHVPTASADQSILLTDVRTGALVHLFKLDFRIFDAAISNVTGEGNGPRRSHFCLPLLESTGTIFYRSQSAGVQSMVENQTGHQGGIDVQVA